MIDVKKIKNQAVQFAKQRPRVAAGIGVITLLLLIVIVRSFGKSNLPPVPTYTTKRGDFLISIVEGGALKAVQEVTVRSELEGTSAIISIIPEGTYVKKGDLLIELDAADLQDRVTAQDVAYQSSQFAYVQGKEALTIQKSVNESTIKDAELKVEFAISDLEKYTEGDSIQMKRDSESKITLAKEDLQRAQERYAWTVKLADKQYASKSDLDTDSLTVKRMTIALDQAEEELRLMTKYTIPKSKRQLEASVDQTRVELMRIKQRCSAQVAQAEADLEARQRTLELNEKRLDHLKEQLRLTKIYAPQDGMVIYASSGVRNSSYLIEEGATVRQKQDLIVLPDVSQMMLQVLVHESHVQQMKEGLRAYVTIDSLPDQKFKGVVKRVALLPDAQSRYYNPNLKVYPTDIVIEDPLPDLKPGVSGRAEIIITNLTDVITVPIQAVTSVKGQQVCFTQNNSEVTPIPVSVGLYNDKFIEIKSGLKDGDTVMLSALSNGDNMNLGGSIINPDEVETNKSLSLNGTNVTAKVEGKVDWNSKRSDKAPAPKAAPTDKIDRSTPSSARH